MNSKYCIKCGHKLLATAEFCSSCGAEQTESTVLTEQPATTVPGLVSATKLVLKSAFTIKGYLKRADYWWSYLAAGMLGTITSAIVYTSYSRLILWLAAIALALPTIAMFTATIRRLHDTGRSGHVYWLTLIPIVGPIIVIIWLAQPTNPEGPKKFSNHKTTAPWHNKWWSWGLLAIVTLVIGASFRTAKAAIFEYQYSAALDAANNDHSDQRAAIASSDTNKSSDSATESKDDGHTITLDDSKIKIADSKTYKTTFNDNSWHDSNFKIDNVTIYKTDGSYKGNSSKAKPINGIVKVHMSIKAGHDISTFPDQGTLNTSNGQQVEADLSSSDSLGGDLNTGATKDGNIYFFLPKLDKVSDLTSLRLKWDAHYDTNNYEDDNSHKTFDATLNLK
ncbi:DUF805 domain-containing protein [Lactiplantibacillus garii]|uniref:DUF805 domain-containing protein n=1 Tax=Lactiplantibacillus garii TaxID=2306423 RepID=A0A3R8KI01_9LACO|nr:DUF805 domain-containing protein [Lactiplantibacillus garii]RRK10245.1 DUF805 domain-containing protein [Lactiplantibacillus garii]